MRAPLLRVPYTDPLPAPRIIPPSATTVDGAIAALANFLAPRPAASHHARKALLITGAGLSVASGLADYRGANGTYTLNRAYRPIYYHEFCNSHEARKRYWARSFLGWPNLERARPNRAHEACAELGRLGVVGQVVTQNVDSFHRTAHPSLPTTELHGYLRALVCLTCHHEYPRATFQAQLAALNPTWSTFLAHLLSTGALATESPSLRRAKGLHANPDGDFDLPDAPYTTFRYPPCPVCLTHPPRNPTSNTTLRLRVDHDGALLPDSECGVLKPAVVMFGESIPPATKQAAELAVDAASRLLVVGSSLATYSAWRLVKRAQDARIPLGVLNIGGVRGEHSFFGAHDAPHHTDAIRISHDAQSLLPAVLRVLDPVHAKSNTAA